MSKTLLPMSSSRIFTVLDLTLMSSICFKFYVWCKIVFEFDSLASSCSVLPTPFIEETVFSPLYILGFVVINWPCISGFISGLSILFHWSVYYTVFITIICNNGLKWGSMLPSALMFFSIALEPIYFLKTAIGKSYPTIYQNIV